MKGNNGDLLANSDGTFNHFCYVFNFGSEVHMAVHLIQGYSK